MKVLDIFTTLLIFGIWNPTISQALSESTNELIRKLEELGNMSDRATSEETRLQILEVVGQFAINCEQNSGPMAEENLGKGIEEFLSCITSEFDWQQLEAEITDARLNGEWKTIFNKYCPKLPAFTECGNGLIVPIKSCFEPEERNTIDIVQDIVRLILEFGCHDGGDLVASFVKFGGIECWNSQEARVQSCAATSYHSQPEDKPVLDNFRGVVIPNLANLSSSLNLSQEKCTDIEDFRTCTVEVFKGCDNPEVASVVDSMFIAFVSFTPCQNMTEAQLRVSKGNLADTITSIGEQVSSGTKSDNYEDILKRKCEKNAGPAAWDALLENYQLVLNSSNLLITSPQFSAEINAAESMEGVYDVFKKYCRRSPILHELYRYFVDSLNSCLELEEQRTVNVIYNSLTAAKDFICYNEGRRTATFLTDQGLNCLFSNLDGILRCADQNLHFYNQILNVSTPGCCDTLPALGSEFCTDVNKFQDCSVKVLAECEDQTTSNLVDLMLTSISNKIQCQNSSEAQIPAVIEISRTTSAPKSNESERIWSESDSDVQFTIGLVDPESTNATSEVVANYIRIKCEKNGGPITFGPAKNLSHYRSDWIEPMTIDLRQLGYNMAEIQGATSYNTLLTAFMKYCRTVPTIVKHIQYLADSIKPCLDLQERTKVDVMRNAASSMLEFGCGNRGNDGATHSCDAECWAKTIEAVGNCFNQFSASDHPSPRSHLLVDSPINDCTKDIREVQRCIVNAMKEYQDPTPGTIMDSLLDHVIQRISCE